MSADSTGFEDRGSPDKRPIFRIGNQTGAHGVLQDILGFGFKLFGISRPVVKEASLPRDSSRFGCEDLQFSDERSHRCAGRKTGDGVQMIRHQQEKATMPVSLLMVVLGGG